MFSSSLRKRPDWSSLPPTLLSQQQPRWKEQAVETHDIALPLPQPDQQEQKHLLRILLLSSTDIQTSSNSMARIERLYNQTGGRLVGIIFLLRESNVSLEDGTRALMSLQASLLSQFEMPIIPLISVSSFLTTLISFQKQFVKTACSRSSIVPNPVTTLLPFCTVDGSIPEHASNVLSDICHSIPELSQAATTPDGQIGLRQWLSDQPPAVVQNIIEFWEQEYVAE